VFLLRRELPLAAPLGGPVPVSIFWGTCVEPTHAPESLKLNFFLLWRELLAGLRHAARIADRAKPLWLLRTDASEIPLDTAKPLRAKASPNEHALVNSFNAQMTASFAGG